MNCDDFSKNGSSSGLTKLFINQNNLLGNGQLLHLNSNCEGSLLGTVENTLNLTLLSTLSLILFRIIHSQSLGKFRRDNDTSVPKLEGVHLKR